MPIFLPFFLKFHKEFGFIFNVSYINIDICYFIMYDLYLIDGTYTVSAIHALMYTVNITFYYTRPLA